MPEKTIQTSRHNTRNRAHSAAPNVATGNQFRASNLRLVADWRHASGKAPDSLLPGVGSEFSNGDRRGWY